MTNIELTNEEANVLLQLIDIAVKANWINVAQPALHLTNKIKEGFKEETEDLEVTK